MGSISTPLLIFCVIIVLGTILLSDPLRKLAIVAVLIGVLWAGSNVFIRTRTCPNDGMDCMMPLQPVWCGPCSASERSAILKINGQYYLAAQPGVVAEASCVDMRFWQ